MQFFKSILALSAFASYVLAANNTITFVNQDSTNRTLVFTPSVPFEKLANVNLTGYETKVVSFPYGWIGNFFAMLPDGDENASGMLGELTFNSWDDLTFFDVSAITNPTDTDGIKQIFPKNSNEPLAGCQEFPCTNIYNVWDDDLATKASTETDYICLIGTLETQRKRGALAAEKMKRVMPLTGEPVAKQ